MVCSNEKWFKGTFELVNADDDCYTWFILRAQTGREVKTLCHGLRLRKHGNGHWLGEAAVNGLPGDHMDWRPAVRRTAGEETAASSVIGQPGIFDLVAESAFTLALEDDFVAFADVSLLNFVSAREAPWEAATGEKDRQYTTRVTQSLLSRPIKRQNQWESVGQRDQSQGPVDFDGNAHFYEIDFKAKRLFQQQAKETDALKERARAEQRRELLAFEETLAAEKSNEIAELKRSVATKQANEIAELKKLIDKRYSEEFVSVREALTNAQQAKLAATADRLDQSYAAVLQSITQQMRNSHSTALKDITDQVAQTRGVLDTISTEALTNHTSDLSAAVQEANTLRKQHVRQAALEADRQYSSTLAGLSTAQAQWCHEQIVTVQRKMFARFKEKCDAAVESNMAAYARALSETKEGLAVTFAQRLSDSKKLLLESWQESIAWERERTQKQHELLGDLNKPAPTKTPLY